MRVFRIYLDTSVIGGCFDKEFAQESLRTLEAVREGKVRLLISDLLLEELTPAPETIRNLIKTLPTENLETISIDQEIERLRDCYLKAKILGPKSKDDATHIAAATIHRADAIVSWNFKHIVRLDKIKAYNQVNLLQGYGILTILSPKEIQFDEEA